MATISLRAFGYNMTSTTRTRYYALQRAIDAHGTEKVIARLHEIKVNIFYQEQTEKDILHVLSKQTLPEEEEDATLNEHNVPVDEPEDDEHTTFIECMSLLNNKLCMATLDKDYDMIHVMVTCMTNVIKSTL